MNRQQLGAFLWLRWRLRRNQAKRSGIANAIVLWIVIVVGLLAAAGLFLAMFFIGLFALSNVSPQVLLYVWDGIVVAFLFLWAVGLLTELQRSESLSLQKFLHLPVSLTGAFLINYVSSLFSINVILAVPAMIGLTLGLTLARGPAMLWLFPLLAGFLLMITALTYQFQGWLAALMANQRRRRTVIVLVTAGLILVCQLPNLINVARPWQRFEDDAVVRELKEQLSELKRPETPGQVSVDETKKRLQEQLQARNDELKEQLSHQAEQISGIVNLCLPPGWLPLGALNAARGDYGVALLAVLGMTVIGGASLWRAYRTTVRLYTGEFTSGKRATPARAAPTKSDPTAIGFLERRLPGLSEHASVIAVASLRGLLRAPEAKMLLLSPIILVVVFGSLMLTRRFELPEAARPLLPLGAIGMVFLTMLQLVGNQFAFDRGGFRVFVLCPARRRDIILGKNLAIAPLAVGMSLVAIVIVQVVYPVRIEYFLAAFPQLLSMYLLFCIFANLLSILAPMPISAGSLKPANPKIIPILLHIAFVFLLPLFLAPALLPIGAEFLADTFAGTRGIPINLVLSLVESVIIAYVYWLILIVQGDLLQVREKKILEVVTSRVE